MLEWLYGPLEDSSRLHKSRCTRGRLYTSHLAWWVTKDGAARETQIRQTGRSKAVTFSIRRPWDVIGQGLPSRFLFPLHASLPCEHTSDGTQSYDQRSSMTPREYSVCVCLLCLSQPPEGRDPGYVVEVHSGQGPDRMWPCREGSLATIGRSADQMTPFVLPTWLTTWNAEWGLNPALCFGVSINSGLKQRNPWWTRSLVINAVTKKILVNYFTGTLWN